MVQSIRVLQFKNVRAVEAVGIGLRVRHSARAGWAGERPSKEVGTAHMDVACRFGLLAPGAAGAWAHLLRGGRAREGHTDRRRLQPSSFAAAVGIETYKTDPRATNRFQRHVEFGRRINR